jgi:TonB-linked SusC/RagA family outer membrane protein
MKYKFYNLFFVFVMISSLLIHGQERIIKGIVSDETGPLPGVSIIIKGATKGAETDFDGNYSIKASAGDILVFSFVGMTTQEKTVGISDIINVILQNDNILDEVVLIGFGTQKKRKVTDNIASISSENIGGIPTPSLQSAFTGKVAGVQVTQINGKVEGGVKVRVRGISTIGASQEPLYVVDGVPIINADESTNNSPINPLISINPNDIESVEILKDASSAAIYGARGTNGVIIITTKKGTFGKTKISLNMSTGFSEATNTRDWLNTAQYVELFEEAAINSGFSVDDLEFFYGLVSFDGNATFDRSIDIDWQDLALVSGTTTDYGVSASGGNEKTLFFISTAYHETEGIIRGNALERYSFRNNIDHNATDKLRLGINTSLSKTIIDRVSNDVEFENPLQAIAQAPLSPALNDDGSANRSTLYYNFLVEEQNGDFETNIWRAIANAYAEYQIIPSLRFRTELGYDNNNQVAERFSGSLTGSESTNGFGSSNSIRTEKFNLNNYFTFIKDFNEAHNFEATLGMSFEESRRKSQFVQGTDFPSDDLQTLNSAGNIIAGGSSKTAFNFVSYFGRATYSIADKYLFKASIRRDGSSRFGKENQFGWFPAASVGWIVSEENFLKDSNTLSLLKIRSSWGITGNAGIRNFASRSLFVGSSYNQLAGLAPIQLGNPSLKWERTSQFDIGLDYGFLNNRITGQIDYYQKNTEDLLLNEPIPGTSGFQNINRNIGEMENSGFEFVLNTKNIATENFTWSTSFNISYNKNEVTNLPGGDILVRRNLVREGESISSFFMAEYAGVDPANGDALYFLNTLNPDGSRDRTTTNNFNDAERVVTGNPFPDVIGGLTNTMKYKGIDFSFTFQGETGASIYNEAGRFQETSGDFFDNQLVSQLGRWQNPGDITNVPQARLFGGNGTGPSTRYLQESDFIRLRNITLGYSLPESVLEKLKMNRVRIYTTGFNLLTITGYNGYDPESTADVNGNSNIGAGVDFYSAPAARTITIGLNIDF